MSLSFPRHLSGLLLKVQLELGLGQQGRRIEAAHVIEYLMVVSGACKAFHTRGNVTRRHSKAGVTLDSSKGGVLVL